MRDEVLKIIGNQIGVEPEDIKEDDSLRDDLHMSSVDITEVQEHLNTLGLAILDFSEIETVAELLEALNLDI